MVNQVELFAHSGHFTRGFTVTLLSVFIASLYKSGTPLPYNLLD
jgi:hypothetical protein